MFEDECFFESKIPDPKLMNYDILVEFGGVAVLFLIGMLVLSGVIYIVKQRMCAESDGKNYYEHFESPNDWSVSAIRSRIDKIVNLKEGLLAYAEDISILADETCMIMKTVEDKYVRNASQLKNEEDYEKPRDEQDRMIKQRETLAKKRFAEQQSMYAAVNGQKPLLECFYADNDDVASAESELNLQLNEMEKILNTAEVKAAALKKEKIGTTLGFSMNYLSDAVKSLETPKVEGFYSELSGPALIAKADAMIGKAASLKNELEDLRRQIDKQNDMIRILNSKQKNEARGGNQAERAADMTRLAFR